MKGYVIKVFFYYMGKGICYKVKFEKRIKKFCDNFDTKKGLHQR